jgi:hypothetical protein
MPYQSFRVENNLELTGSVDTLIRFCREEIDLYNGS